MSLPACPHCQSDYVYRDQNLLVCPECSHEWDPNQDSTNDDEVKVKDANGTLLNAGDKVTFIKDLKIKGSSQVLKIGAKALIRRVVQANDHQLDCKVIGGSEMMITAKFVKKS